MSALEGGEGQGAGNLLMKCSTELSKFSFKSLKLALIKIKYFSKILFQNTSKSP